MSKQFELIFPDIPSFKIIDLMTKRVVGVAEIIKYCKSKSEIVEIINKADYIDFYSRKKLLKQLNLERSK